MTFLCSEIQLLILAQLNLCENCPKDHVQSPVLWCEFMWKGASSLFLGARTLAIASSVTLAHLLSTLHPDLLTWKMIGLILHL